MKLTINVQPDEAAFDQLAARRIYDQIAAKPDSVIGLSTGRTTGNMHRILAGMLQEKPLPLAGITFFGQDEITGVPQAYWGACYTMLRSDLMDALGIDAAHFLMLSTRTEDYPASARAFPAELEARGGIDLLILGLGENGHLGFNQPGTPFGSTTRVAPLAPELDARVRRDLNLDPGHGLGGATLGLQDVMHARRLILAAKGRHKAAIVKQMLQGPVTEAVPASVLQLHPACEFLLDADAAALL